METRKKIFPGGGGAKKKYIRSSGYAVRSQQKLRIQMSMNSVSMDTMDSPIYLNPAVTDIKGLVDLIC